MLALYIAAVARATRYRCSSTPGRPCSHELGIDPSRDLAAMYEAILRHDSKLDLPHPRASDADQLMSPGPTGAPVSLPMPPTPFIGRESELLGMRELIKRSDVQLVTLTGAGGIGKSRVAIEAATTLIKDYPGGVWFVGLRTP